MALSRNADSVTSFEAADKLYESGRWKQQVWKVFFTLRKHQGCTYRELNEHLPFEDRNTSIRRLGDLRRMGLVCNGVKRVCRVSGKQCLTWWIASNWAQRAERRAAREQRQAQGTTGSEKAPTGPERSAPAAAAPEYPARVLTPEERRQLREQWAGSGDESTRRFLAGLEGK